jgi:uncharacterized protein (DUF433 family)
MPWSNRIVVDPDILAGKPVISGTRLAVELILELLAAGQSDSDILANYPGLTREDILACLSLRKLSGTRVQSLPNSCLNEISGGREHSSPDRRGTPETRSRRSLGAHRLPRHKRPRVARSC